VAHASVKTLRGELSAARQLRVTHQAPADELAFDAKEDVAVGHDQREAQRNGPRRRVRTGEQPLIRNGEEGKDRSPGGQERERISGLQVPPLEACQGVHDQPENGNGKLEEHDRGGYPIEGLHLSLSCCSDGAAGRPLKSR
jgi:hypothetical protein